MEAQAKWPSSAKWYAANLERARETRRQYYEENREQILSRQRTRYQEDPALVAERQRRYRENNRTAIRARSNEWARKRRALLREQLVPRNMLNAARARARKAGVPCTITINDVTAAFGEACPILGLKFKMGAGRVSANSPTLDRIVPSLGYVPGNVIVISHRANRIKTDACATEILAVAKWLETVTNDGTMRGGMA